MSFDTISTLEIPQEATELTLNELKLICGGHQGEEKPKCKLVKKIVTVKKIFKCGESKNRTCGDTCGDNSDGGCDDN
jgi:hypothetical protein